jgi:hypothetical protein
MVGGAMNFNSPSIPIIFRQSGTERMRIDSSGNVNIKTGNLSIGQSSENNISNTTGETWIGSNGLRYNSGSDTFARSSATAQAAMMVLTTTADVEFYTQPSTSDTGTYALTPKMVIKGNGNVGIGTDTITNPYSQTPFTDLNIDGTWGGVISFKLGGTEKGWIGQRSSGNADMALGASSGQNLLFYTDGTNERMRITSGGTIFMYALGGYTASYADVRYDTTSKELYYQTSSKRYKTDIVNLENSLDKINSLRPVRYKDINTETLACGLIAEEVVETIPEVVFKKEIEGFDEPQIEGLNYTDLIPFLIKSIQELKAEIDDLKNKCNCK